MAGRIGSLIIDIVIFDPDFDHAQFTPIPTETGRDMLEAQKLRTGTASLRVSLYAILDASGSVMTSTSDLTRSLGGDWEGRAQGSFFLPGGHVLVGGELVPLRGITYDVPMTKTHVEFRVGTEAQPRVTIQREGEEALIFTDADLRRVRFDEDGTVQVLPPSA
jgi:hypothetical protein